MTEDAASQALAEQGILGVVVLGLAWACVFLLRAYMKSQEARTRDALTTIMQAKAASEETTAAVRQLTGVVSRLTGVRGDYDVAVSQE